MKFVSQNRWFLDSMHINIRTDIPLALAEPLGRKDSYLVPDSKWAEQEPSAGSIRKRQPFHCQSVSSPQLKLSTGGQF